MLYFGLGQSFSTVDTLPTPATPRMVTEFFAFIQIVLIHNLTARVQQVNQRLFCLANLRIYGSQFSEA
jgi:hypothetical protein